MFFLFIIFINYYLFYQKKHIELYLKIYNKNKRKICNNNIKLLKLLNYRNLIKLDRSHKAENIRIQRNEILATFNIIYKVYP